MPHAPHHPANGLSTISTRALSRCSMDDGSRVEIVQTVRVGQFESRAAQSFVCRASTAHDFQSPHASDLNCSPKSADRPLIANEKLVAKSAQIARRSEGDVCGWRIPQVSFRQPFSVPRECGFPCLPWSEICSRIVRSGMNLWYYRKIMPTAFVKPASLLDETTF